MDALDVDMKANELIDNCDGSVLEDDVLLNKDLLTGSSVTGMTLVVNPMSNIASS